MPHSEIMTHYPVILGPDPSRTVVRPFAPEDPPDFSVPGHPRIQCVVDRVRSLSPARLEELSHRVTDAMAQRYRNIEAYC